MCVKENLNRKKKLNFSSVFVCSGSSSGRDLRRERVKAGIEMETERLNDINCFQKNLNHECFIGS